MIWVFASLVCQWKRHVNVTADRNLQPRRMRCIPQRWSHLRTHGRTLHIMVIIPVSQAIAIAIAIADSVFNCKRSRGASPKRQSFTAVRRATMRLEAFQTFRLPSQELVVFLMLAEVRATQSLLPRQTWAIGYTYSVSRTDRCIAAW